MMRRFAAPVLTALLLVAVASLSPAGAEPVRIMAYGDSLTAGYGLPQGHGFTVQLEKRLRADGLDVRIINAGVSGDTSSGGRARLNWTLSEPPDAIILELGANDGLRGIDPGLTRENLDAILSHIRSRAIPVLFTGMYAPPNLGTEFGDEFRAVYDDLARIHDVAYYPFFLDGVAGQPALNQDDGIHPNADGVAVIVERLLPAVKQLLNQVP